MLTPQKLTKNGILKMLDLNEKNVIVQLLSLEPFEKEGKSEVKTYFKTTISDGFCKTNAVLANEAAKKILNNVVLRNSIIQITDMIANKRGEKQNTIILDFNPVRRNVNAQIGDPKKVEDYRLSNLVNSTGDDSIPLPYFSQEKKEFEEEELENNEGPEFDKNLDTFQKFLYESKEKNMSKDKQKEKSEENKRVISEQSSDTPSFAAPILGAYKKKLNPFETNIKLDKIFNVPQPQSTSGEKGFDNKRRFEQTPARRPIERSEGYSFYNSDEYYLPIKSLSPLTDSWRIKAKVVKKFEVKTFNRNGRDGCLLKIQLLDKYGGEIQAIFFNELAQHYNSFLIEGKVYGFAKGIIQKPNPQYSSYSIEIKFDSHSNPEIVPLEDDKDIGSQTFKFKKINEINGLEIGSKCDVIGITMDVEEAVEITIKTGEKRTKRKLILVDETAQIELALWGSQASHPFENDQIIAFKSLTLKEFNGMNNLNSTFETVIETKEILTTPEAKILLELKDKNQYQIFSSNKKFNDHKKSGKYCSLATILEETERLDEFQPKKFFDFSAYLAEIEEGGNLYYVACPNEKCNKKVVEEEGGFRCESCSKHYENCKLRYTLRGKLVDHSGSFRMTIFGDYGISLLGVAPEEIQGLINQDENEQVSVIFKSKKWTPLKGRMMAKLDNYNNEPRTKYSLVQIYSKNVTESNKEMINEINQYLSY